jgi:hypothetical protein
MLTISIGGIIVFIGKIIVWAFFSAIMSWIPACGGPHPSKTVSHILLAIYLSVVVFIGLVVFTDYIKIVW